MEFTPLISDEELLRIAYEEDPEFIDSIKNELLSVTSSGALQVTSEEDPDELEGEECETIVSSSVDYTELLNSINTHLENIEYSQVVQGNDLYQIQQNTYRLYYFIGGIYVAFAIVLAIRFLKIFF